MLEEIEENHTDKLKAEISMHIDLLRKDHLSHWQISISHLLSLWYRVQFPFSELHTITKWPSNKSLSTWAGLTGYLLSVLCLQMHTETQQKSEKIYTQKEGTLTYANATEI